MFGRIGIIEIIFIALIIVLLFGVKALPDIAKSIAKSIKAFKREAREIKDSFEEESPKTTDPLVTGDKNDFKAENHERNWRADSTTSEKV